MHLLVIVIDVVVLKTAALTHASPLQFYVVGRDSVPGTHADHHDQPMTKLPPKCIKTYMQEMENGLKCR